MCETQTKEQKEQLLVVGEQEVDPRLESKL